MGSTNRKWKKGSSNDNRCLAEQNKYNKTDPGSEDTHILLMLSEGLLLHNKKTKKRTAAAVMLSEEWHPHEKYYESFIKTLYKTAAARLKQSKRLGAS